MPRKPIGTLLHEITVHYLEEKEMTTREFAKMCGLSQSNVMKLKTETNPNFYSHKIDDFLNGMDLSLAELYEKYDK